VPGLASWVTELRSLSPMMLSVRRPAVRATVGAEFLPGFKHP